MNARLSVVAAVLALASCTGPSTPAATIYADPIAWANVYCNGTLRANMAGREMDPQNLADPAGYKESLLKVQAAAAEAYSESARQLDGLGPPGPDAVEAHKNLVQFVRDLADHATRYEARLRAIEPDAEFHANVEKMVASLTDLSTIERTQDIVKAFAVNPAYIDALQNAPKCVEIRDRTLANPPTN
ncbi:hypothetical protein LFM09_21860 [Lentzea alba]|uniref:hypothetical protein n=1 Tax=Lentzea alba TaxID=2714351 RepID=UPI0039BF0A6F